MFSLSLINQHVDQPMINMLNCSLFQLFDQLLINMLILAVSATIQLVDQRFGLIRKPTMEANRLGQETNGLVRFGSVRRIVVEMQEMCFGETLDICNIGLQKLFLIKVDQLLINIYLNKSAC